jgi:hypothetical protein
VKARQNYHPDEAARKNGQEIEREVRSGGEDVLEV